MMRVTVLLRAVSILPTQAVSFAYSREDAAAAVRDHYAHRYFGASSDFLGFAAPKAHFVPFFLADGTAAAEYSVSVGRTVTVKNESRTIWTPFPGGTMAHAFQAHNEQVYAGFRRDTKHVRVLAGGEALATEMKPMREVDLSRADDVNLFELSVGGMRRSIAGDMEAEVKALVRRYVKGVDPMASQIRINLHNFRLNIREVQPVFVPAYVVDTTYDDLKYKIIVCGLTGRVQGPYLYNPEMVGRLSGGAAALLPIASVALGAFATASAPATLAAASLLGVASYFGGFYAAKQVPNIKIEYRRRQQVEQQARSKNETAEGAVPGNDNEQPQQQSVAGERRAASNSRRDGSNEEPWMRLGPRRDADGHYAALGLAGDESLNAVRAAYRRRAMKNHPDHGGSGDKMQTINAAYQVLRDRRRRVKYDQL
jgi:hypothetical protein